MDAQEKSNKIAAFVERSRAVGSPITPQRRAVLEAVLELDNHPSADAVHAQVLSDLPDLNRTTVYRALDSLVDLGVIRRVSHSKRAVRFDPDTNPHHHLLCTRCSEIQDFHEADIAQLSLPDTSNVGFEVVEIHVELRGICRSCRSKLQD